MKLFKKEFVMQRLMVNTIIANLFSRWEESPTPRPWWTERDRFLRITKHTARNLEMGLPVSVKPEVDIQIRHLIRVQRDYPTIYNAAFLLPMDVSMRLRYAVMDEGGFWKFISDDYSPILAANNRWTGRSALAVETPLDPAVYDKIPPDKHGPARALYYRDLVYGVWVKAWGDDSAPHIPLSKIARMGPTYDPIPSDYLFRELLPKFRFQEREQPKSQGGRASHYR